MGASRVEVDFEGLLVHITGTPHRAVVPADPHGNHTPRLYIGRGANLSQIDQAFPGQCPQTPCLVKLPIPVALTLTDGSPSSTPVMSHAEFQNHVPHLGPYASGLHPDVTAAFPASGDVVAVTFDLHGAQVTRSIKVPCSGQLRFPDGTTGALRPFNGSSKMVYLFNDAARLEVRLSADSTPIPIDLGNGFFELKLSNYSGQRNDDHIHLLEKLFTGTTSFPTGVKKDPNCYQPQELDVPGCGNTQWP